MPSQAKVAIAVSAVALIFATAPHHVSAQALTVTPANPTIQTGQTQQFSTLEASPAAGVEAGDYHVCVQLQNGEARCFGRNNTGQLGSDGADSSTPISPIQFTQGAGVTAGGFHSCAVRLNGTVQCWGMNETGQLGDGTTTPSAMPVTVIGITNAVAVGAGYQHTCALLEDGRVQCWGDNTYGQLGNGASISQNTPRGSASTLHSSVPVTVVGITTAVSVTASDGYHSCAVLQNGTAKCWGDNVSGQLGNGTRSRTSTPIAVTGLANAARISSGDFHTCALLQTGGISCWGLNWSGQLGDGTGSDADTPVNVSGITNAVSVSVGVLHTCAALADGGARCWGYNANGQIGNGTTANAYTPAVVSGITSALSVAAGNDDSCAVLGGGLVRCWGMNTYGELGNGTTSNASTPTVVVDINPAWTSSSPAVATINQTGLATAVAGGSTTITASIDLYSPPWDRSGPKQHRTGSTTLSVGGSQTKQLTVVRNGNGSVTSSPSGINCGSTCSAAFAANTSVTLTAATLGGSVFTGWNGCDTASGSTCTVAMSASRSVTATFTTPTLTVNKSGTGRGTVTSADSGINCGPNSSSCAASYGNGTAVSLTAAPETGSTFVSWSGCDSTNGAACGVTMNGSKTVTASFAVQRFTLSVSKGGNGTGTVSSSPAGISCGGTCAADFNYATSVTLTAAPALGSTFVGWTGCDSSSGASCTVSMTAAKSVMAAFVGVPFP